MHPDDPTVTRLRKHLGSVKRVYPKAWDHLAWFRTQKAKLGGWPSWCDVPLTGAHAIVAAGSPHLSELQRAANVSVVGGLGTWRLTQGVYRFDPDLFEALWTTPVERVPTELLYRLPEWCVYIETHKFDFEGRDIFGAFVWLEWDVNTKRPELRALLDAESMLMPLVLHLTEASLDACVGSVIAAARSFNENAQVPDETFALAEQSLRDVWPPLLSLVLYLCSEAPDIADERKEPDWPKKPDRSKRTGIIIPASNPKAWVIGSRIGMALRCGGSRVAGGGTHASPRAHVRRAHWSHYWTGPKTAPQTPVLHWIHPILVGAEEELPVTIHPAVKEEA